MNPRTARAMGLTALVLAALALPLGVTLPYFQHLIILALIWVVLAQGQNLIQGFTGYVSIAQAGFMGIGAYGSTLLSVKLGWPVWLTMAAAPAGDGRAGRAGRLPEPAGQGALLRDRDAGLQHGHLHRAHDLEFAHWRGSRHLERASPAEMSPSAASCGISRGRVGYYYLALIAAALATLLCALILHSRVGRVLLAIRQNEALIEAAGVQAWRYKLFAFVVSASLAGLAGALYAHFIGFLNPDAFGVDHSLNAILAVILGGSGTLSGPVVGAFAVVFLPEYLRVAENYRLVIYGFILVAATIFMPRGLVPLVAQGLRALAARVKREPEMSALTAGRTARHRRRAWFRGRACEAECAGLGPWPCR